MKILEELERRIQNLENSKSHQSFQIQDPYSIFQVPHQEEHTDLEKSTEFMIQFQSDLFNMIEARLVDWKTCVGIRKLSLPNL